MANKPADRMVEVRFESRHFIPKMLEVAARQPFSIRLKNASKERIEFESFKLRFERVARPGETIVVAIPALAPGRYDFFDDFHDDVPDGVIVAK